MMSCVNFIFTPMSLCLISTCIYLMDDFNLYVQLISVSECDGNTVKFCLLMLNLVLGQLDYLRNKECFSKPKCFKRAHFLSF